MRPPRLILPATGSLVALALTTGCPGVDPPPPDISCRATSTALDQTTLARWQAQALKTCALAAVFPHRAGDVVTTVANGGHHGWDTARVLDGADANGVRAFDADGLAFAGFASFTDMPVAWTRREQLAAIDTCGGDDAALAARVDLVDGICTVEVDGEVVFAQPLHPSTTVIAASWPGLTPPRWVPRAPAPAPSELADGFEHVTATAIPMIDGFAGDLQRAAEIGSWLGVERADAENHMRFALDRGPTLLTSPALAMPPLVLDGGEHPVLSRAEGDALRAATDLRLEWHYLGVPGRPTDWDSTFEVTTRTLRYTGGRPRTTAAAASAAATCARTLIERALAAHPVEPTWAAPIGDNWRTCARLTTDLVAAIAADDAALATVLDLWADAARARYGLAGADGTLEYLVPSDELPAVVARAMVDGAPALGRHAPSVTLDHVLGSWRALNDASVMQRYPVLAARLANAVLDRANARTFRPTRLAPLSATDAAAIAAYLDAAPQPLSEASIVTLLLQVSNSATPAAQL